MHTRFKSFGRYFVEFWNEYFQSTGKCVRDLPIKHFLSAVELVNLCDLSQCCCKNLLAKLYKEKQFRCQHCEKSFSTEAALRWHRSQHELEKPRFDCVFCPRNFATKVAVLRHMELHTNDYTCEVCQQALHYKDYERHKKTTKHLKRAEALRKHKESRK